MLKSIAAKKVAYKLQKLCLGYSSWLTAILYDKGWAMNIFKSFALKESGLKASKTLAWYVLAIVWSRMSNGQSFAAKKVA